MSRLKLGALLMKIASRLRRIGESIAGTPPSPDPRQRGMEELRRAYDELEGTHNALVARWEATRVPPALITTMPKSGTYFISKLLSEGLSVKSTIVSNQYFPDDTIRFPALRELAAGNHVSQDHFAASRVNLAHISGFLDRLVCHVRDPRQAMLSWVHHIEGFAGNPETFLFIYPTLPRDYYQQSFEHKLDWAIESWLPLLIEWTEGWIRAAEEQNGIEIKITHYETMVRDRIAFVNEILDFFAIPRERFIPPPFELNSEVNFRKGEPEEWRRVLNEKQRARATEKISTSLAERMGWSLDS